MSNGWLDLKGVRTVCVAISAIQILIGIINLAYIPSEMREFEAWQSHAESPTTAPSTPAAAARPNPRRELIRFVKQQLDLDRECNFTTWLASMQCALIGFVALLLAFQSARREWLLVMGGFLYLSMDELCQVHEWVGVQIAQSGFRIGALGPPYPWVIVFGPLFLLYAVGVARFLHRQLASERGLRRRALLALALMGSSLPLEALGGELQGDAPRPPRLEVIAEESFETLGGTLFLYVLLTLLVLRSSGSPATEPTRAKRSQRG
jgi:hypothetical protein